MVIILPDNEPDLDFSLTGRRLPPNSTERFHSRLALARANDRSCRMTGFVASSWNTA